MAPSSQSEYFLDLEQVTLQEAHLPPPIQRVMDPGQFRYFVKIFQEYHVTNDFICDKQNVCVCPALFVL